MKKPLIIIGAGGYAKILIELVRLSGLYRVEAVIGLESDSQDTILGEKILKGDKYIQEYLDKGINLVAIAIGAYTSNKRRAEIFNYFQEQGFTVVSLIHPSAEISPSVKIGAGAVINAGVIINSDVTIGDDVSIAPGTVIEHEAVINDHVLLSTASTIGAGSVIGNSALLGVASVIIPRVKVGANALVAAGAVVVSDIPDNSRVFGIPAKPKP